MVGNVFSFIEGCIIVYAGKRGRKNQWKNQTGYINFGVLENSNDSFNVEFHQLLVIYFQTNRNLWRENYIEKFDMLKPLTFWFIQCRCDHCLLSSLAVAVFSVDSHPHQPVPDTSLPPMMNETSNVMNSKT